MSIEDGVFHLDGVPRFLVSGDYPYYRDDPASWPVQLDAIKSMGIDTVSCYIPWRHHAIPQPDGTILHDFEGSTRPSRNVIRFLELIREKGMHVIAKPGPFIHAETVYGGLPDVTCPRNNPAIVPSRNAWGHENKWFFMFGKPLPSPLDEPFVSMVKDYMKRVGEVLQRFVHPSGPVVAIQILNEGIYSQGNISLDNFEYAPGGVHAFRAFLQEKYGTIDAFNAAHGTRCKTFDDIPPPRPRGIKRIRSPRDALAIVDWGEFATVYYNAVMDAYLEGLHAGGPATRDLPVVINTNPPSTAKQGADTFLVRMVPESMHAHYGYTNWIGVVPHREDSFYRYMILVKRFKGMNLEENWGFSEYYDPLYAFGHVSYYQTLLAMAFGTTGFNVYTAAATSSWYPDLDGSDPPYPKSAPVAESGVKRDKCALIEFITTLAATSGLGSKLATATSNSTMHLGLYIPYATLHSWIGNDVKRWRKAGFSQQPSVAEHAWTGFHLAAEHAGLDYTPVNVEDAASIDALVASRGTLLLVSGGFLAREVQDRLASLVKAGGRLVIAGTLPSMDDRFQPCTTLQEFIEAGRHADETSVKDVFGRTYRITCTTHASGGETWAVHGNPFQRSLDKYEKRFYTILHFLKALIPVGSQIPDANAEGELGTKLKWMDNQYTRNALPFATPLVREIARSTGWQQAVSYRDEILAGEQVRVKGHGNLVLQRRVYKVFTRRHIDEPMGEVTDFIFVFSRSDEALDVAFSVNDHPRPDRHVDVSMHLPPRSAHLLVVRGGKISALIVNGVVSFNGTREIMWIEAGDDRFETDTPCDMLFIDEGETNIILAAYVDGERACMIRNGARMPARVLAYGPDRAPLQP